MSATARTLVERIGLLVAALVCTGVALCPAHAMAVAAKPFGLASFTMQTTEGESVVEKVVEAFPQFDLEKSVSDFTQAGGHPWALTTTFVFTSEEAGKNPPAPVPTGDPKDIIAALPPGLLGNPNQLDFPACPVKTVLAKEKCGTDTQLGVARLRWFGDHESLAPIVNVVPEKGQSAEFGLEAGGGPTTLLTVHVVRSGSTYGLVVESNDIPSGIDLVEVETTFWGVPADPGHDPMRGLYCEGIDVHGNVLETCGGGNIKSGLRRVPFLKMPTDCAAGPEVAIGRADSWEEPGGVREGRYTGYQEKTWTMPGVTGCGLLTFEPGIEVQPDTLLADAPVSLGVNLTVPQVEGGEENVGTPATPELRNASVTLPEGVSISPGIVDGIQACNESGPEGINFEGPESEEVAPNGELQLAPGHCPDASIVGSAKAFTPLQNEPVEGHVYLARPGCGGPGQHECGEQDAADGNLYQLYLELGGTGALGDAGVNLKVRLKVKANPATGQLTAVADDNPQFPFSKLSIDLNGGPRASLDNPAVCGRATTTADFTPWSAPGTTPEGLFMAGTQDATPTSYFDVTGCSSPTPFHPGFVTGTVTPNAGQFSSFTMNLSRQDREQFVKGIQVHTPPGLLGMLASVPLCGEPEAGDGHCPESAKIGTTRVATGAGSHPFEIEGDVYLTGPYKGAPFGLSIVTHAVAGPFNLGLVIVRARIAVDPETSQLTITTDEAGPFAIPQILDGVPLRLQRVTVDIDRPGFMFNPTNCGAPGAPGTQTVSANVAGAENAVASVQSQFAVGGCQSLAFKPSFTVSTSGHTSKADGASLDAKVSYPAGSMGSEANIASVKVELPKQLPSRLTTLQKACTAAQFAANPAGCPQASIVGIVRASTPLLPVGLSGPAYFVSHGGEAFPSLIVVLQGDGVRVDLTGSTFISKAGITSSTFKTVPDVPVNTFELYLPEGPYSALAANGNLCDLTTVVTTKRKVTKKVHGRTVRKTVAMHTTKPATPVMPSEFVAQNGTVLKQNTKVQVTGCTVSKVKRRARQTAHKSTSVSGRRSK
jgi:hypothetical protein